VVDVVDDMLLGLIHAEGKSSSLLYTLIVDDVNEEDDNDSINRMGTVTNAVELDGWKSDLGDGDSTNVKCRFRVRRGLTIDVADATADVAVGDATCDIDIGTVAVADDVRDSVLDGDSIIEVEWLCFSSEETNRVIGILAGTNSLLSWDIVIGVNDKDDSSSGVR
jgi:hypothetical protein